MAAPVRYPWWRAFVTRKSIPTTQESGETQPSGEKMSPISSKSTPDSKGNETFPDAETFDDAEFEPMFNEKTCRRNLKVSRSGRFKENRRVRGTIPDNNNFSGSTLMVTPRGLG
uniref:Si:dkeyp-86h10.3 n=1 Tax=Salmo trutta TaxID=8032 RepID=A0A674CDJ8_SALTR